MCVCVCVCSVRNMWSVTFIDCHWAKFANSSESVNVLSTGKGDTNLRHVKRTHAVDTNIIDRGLWDPLSYE